MGLLLFPLILVLESVSMALTPQAGLSVGYTRAAHPDRPWSHFFFALDGSLGFLEPHRAYGVSSPVGVLDGLGRGREVWQAGIRAQARMHFDGSPGACWPRASPGR